MPTRALSFILQLLSSCTGGKWTMGATDSCDSDTSSTDTASDTDTSGAYDVLGFETIAALPWKPELLDRAGTSGGASQRGFWVNDPSREGESFTAGGPSYAYRVPWSPDGDDVQEAADITVSAGVSGARVVGMDAGTLSVNTIDAVTGDYAINRMPEPTESGDLSDLVDLKLVFDDSGSTYWNQSGMMDADGDGSADDLVTAGRAGFGTNTGRIALVVDAPSAGTLTAADMTMLDACEERSGADVAFGAMAVTPDADGSVWVTCASSDRATGYAEHRASLSSEPDARVLGVSGWSASPDPRGGVWLGAEGAGEVVYAHTDGTSERYAMEGFPFFGSAPAVVEVGDQIVLAVGALGTYEAPASAVYVYEITGSTDLDTIPYNRLEPDGNVLCLGGVNALVGRSDGLYLASSGFLLDTEQGCGIQMWGLEVAP